MTVRNLEALLRPRSLAVIGASNRPGSIGTRVMANLLAAGFAGPIMPVNPRHSSVSGVLCYPSAEQLPVAPDLAVICTPAASVASLLATLGAAGTRAAVVISAGLDAAGEQQLREAARPWGLRILGPNCLGLIVPGIGLNASFAPGFARAGRLAFITQSGAMATVVLDWAAETGTGFSHFISLGNSADVDFGDLLDWLAGDPGTDAILLYVESVQAARKFMSAGRAAARNKPVIVLKGGRSVAGQAAAATHTGALAGSDEVYSAAFSRAGMLRVHAFAELFAAVETLSRRLQLRGSRLLLLTNGGGPGVLATDAWMAAGGTMAPLPPALVAALDGVLPPGWSRANPMDIVGDATAERYRPALAALRASGTDWADALLLLHAPTAVADSEGVAQALLPELRDFPLPLLTCWPGGADARRARQLCAGAGIAAYATPEDAVTALRQTLEYRANQSALMETPPWPPEDFAVDLGAARALIAGALATGRGLLDAAEAQALLQAFGIPTAPARVAADAEQAAGAAVALAGPVALKLLSGTITHKSDVGGVMLDLAGPAEVQAAATAMLERLAAARPDARVEGFLVQRMARRRGAHELIAGIGSDATFGPVILFGHGGTAVEVLADRSIGLPPLNAMLAAQMVRRTRVWKLLAGFRDQPAANLDAICDVLVRLSRILIELPEVAGLDINPLLADAEGVIALDARVLLVPHAGPAEARLAIRPYPRHLEERIQVAGSELLLRPIRPEDEPAHRRFLEQLTPTDIRFRFFGLLREFPHSELARYTQIDYDREMAFIATRPGSDGTPETLGEVRAISGADNRSAEFAVVVRSDLHGQGLGLALMEKLIRHAGERGIGELVGHVLRDNRPMLELATRLGFHVTASDGEQHTVTLVTGAGNLRP